jgi:hypothetical protein
MKWQWPWQNDSTVAYRRIAGSSNVAQLTLLRLPVFYIAMQYFIQNNVHPSLLHKFLSGKIPTPHVATELPVRISVAQFVAAMQNNPQGPWSVNDVIADEVCHIHITNTFPRS